MPLPWLYVEQAQHVRPSTWAVMAGLLRTPGALCKGLSCCRQHREMPAD